MNQFDDGLHIVGYWRGVSVPPSIITSISITIHNRIEEHALLRAIRDESSSPSEAEACSFPVNESFSPEAVFSKEKR